MPRGLFPVAGNVRERLTDERDALLKLDVGALYAMGVHGLLLRPFTILHKVAEPDYLRASRGE